MNIIKRLIKNLKYHQTLINIFFVLFVLSAFALGILYSQIQAQLDIQYRKTFEKKSFSQLETYHFGKSQLVSGFYKDDLSIVVELSEQKLLVDALNSGDSKEIQEILDLFRTSQKNFTSFAILDRSRKLLYVSSDYPEVSRKNLGKILPERDYLVVPFLKKHPVIGQIVVSTGTGESTQAFSAPILDSSGNAKFVIAGTITLKRLLAVTDLVTSFTKFDSLIVDKDGNVILNGVNPSTEMISLKGKEPLVDALIAGKRRNLIEEINYANKNVLALGSVLNFGDDNRVYLISFYPKDQLIAETESFKGEFDRIFLSLLVWVYLIVLTAFLSITWLIRRHEKLLSNRQDGKRDEI